MFFGKPKMDEEERKKWSDEIERLMDEDKTREAYEKTLEFEKLDKDAAGYHMSYFSPWRSRAVPRRRSRPLS